MYGSEVKGEGLGWRNKCGSQQHLQATRPHEITEVNKRSEDGALGPPGQEQKDEPAKERERAASEKGNGDLQERKSKKGVTNHIPQCGEASTDETVNLNRRQNAVFKWKRTILRCFILSEDQAGDFDLAQKVLNGGP